MATGNDGHSFTSLRIKQEPIDTNGVDAGRPGRLTTFKVPRDLTLGGAGPLRTQRGNANKKVYTPNLNVSRNKNLNVKTSKDSTTRGRGRIDRGKQSDRGGRGRGGNRGGLVQTTGLFSEGAGALQVKKSSSSGSYRSSSGEGEDTGGLRRPTLVKREGKIDTSAENQHIKDLVGESDDEDFKDEKTDQEFIPIKLNEAKWTVSNIEADIQIKKEIKSEEGENEVVADKLSYMKVKHEIITPDRYPANLEELFSRSRQQLFLMQLPDSLPCQEADTSDKPSTSKEKSDTTEPIRITSTLNSLDEGQIGKIVRYRSGKFKLILGETSFDLDLGTESGFLQEAMSISTNREERSGNMINLGPIQAKIEATPDWDFLFKNCS